MESMQGMCQLKKKLIFRPAHVKRLATVSTPGKSDGLQQRKVKMTANIVDPVKEMESRSRRQEEMIRNRWTQLSLAFAICWFG